MAWLDTGTYEGLIQAGNFVETLQKRQGMYISCPEEIAYRRGFIDNEQLMNLGKQLSKTEYGKYLVDLAKGKIE